MSTRFGSKLAGAALAAVAALALLAPAAQATPITFYNVAGTHDTARFNIGCGSASGDCAGLLEAVSDESPLAWSSTIGQMFGGLQNANPTTEMNFVNTTLGTAFTENSGNISPASGNPFEFYLTAEYLLIKVGGGPTHQAYALLHNLGGDLDLWFTEVSKSGKDSKDSKDSKDGQAGGLSHYITFGSAVTQVPEPAALGMFGLGLLLVGGLAASRRRYV